MKVSKTAYDDAFRTLLNDCTSKTKFKKHSANLSNRVEMRR